MGDAEDDILWMGSTAATTASYVEDEDDNDGGIYYDWPNDVDMAAV